MLTNVFEKIKDSKSVEKVFLNKTSWDGEMELGHPGIVNVAKFIYWFTSIFADMC